MLITKKKFMSPLKIHGKVNIEINSRSTLKFMPRLTLKFK